MAADPQPARRARDRRSAADREGLGAEVGRRGPARDPPPARLPRQRLPARDAAERRPVRAAERRGLVRLQRARAHHDRAHAAPGARARPLRGCAHPWRARADQAQARSPGRPAQLLRQAARRPALRRRRCRDPARRLPGAQGARGAGTTAPVLDRAAGGLRDPSRRILPRAIRRVRVVPARHAGRSAARRLLRQHLGPALAADLPDAGDLPARGRAGASLPGLARAGDDRAAEASAAMHSSRPSTRVGRSTPSRSATTSDSTTIRTASWAHSRPRSDARRGWWSTLACTPKAGRASRPSST